MKLVRYLFVGGAAAIVDFVLFMLLAWGAGWPWFPTAVLSFSLATLVNYALSIRHVFESGVRFSQGHELILVYLVSAIGLTVNQAVLWFGIETAHIDMLAAKLGATGTVFFWNYAARRYFIFNHDRRPSDDTVDVAPLDYAGGQPARDN